ncbi:hypothetical protein GCM10027160_03480 [Streptomyces calidiresistens]|uniref:DUF4440 domain-containing protein n=1 Tax=Streptomyces calidiresistens TaxID=1485586 RepID=A0A7W3XXH5_9ACTN|nr:nuclear transport factor 2 family protein [Streptomyces calidiresistens]MBB0230811.1 DUF4440 domain-containing protein [Streptomyces calidiresistens]
MGQAREVMDRLTEALTTTRDLKTVADCFAEDAVFVAPDAGEIRGRERIVEYWRQFMDAMPDVGYEPLALHEDGDSAIDEGFMVGTNTGPLVAPDGERIPPTGRHIRVVGCDRATVVDGHIVEHRVYFDRMEFLGQLGLLPEPTP